MKRELNSVPDNWAESGHTTQLARSMDYPGLARKWRAAYCSLGKNSTMAQRLMRSTARQP
jgi:hypothetical protein